MGWGMEMGWGMMMGFSGIGMALGLHDTGHGRRLGWSMGFSKFYV